MKPWVLFNKSTKISLNASSVYCWIKGAWHYAFLFSEGSFCFTVRQCHLLGVWENSNAAGCLVTLSKLCVSDVNGKRQIRLSGNSWNITHRGLLRSRFSSLLTLQKAELDLQWDVVVFSVSEKVQMWSLLLDHLHPHGLSLRLYCHWFPLSLIELVLPLLPWSSECLTDVKNGNTEEFFVSSVSHRVLLSVHLFCWTLGPRCLFLNIKQYILKAQCVSSVASNCKKEKKEKSYCKHC